MAEAVAFYTLSALILGFAVLVVSARHTVHSVLFLVANFLFVAALYVVLAAEFMAVIQILVYAGGIVVLYLFVVMLVNLKRRLRRTSIPGAPRASACCWRGRCCSSWSRSWSIPPRARRVQLKRWRLRCRR